LHVVVNQEIKAAQTVEVLLGLVVEQGARLDFINVSTGVNMLTKLVSKRATRMGRTPVGKRLREDAGFAQLITWAPVMSARNIGNTLNTLSKLQAAAGAMSPAGWATMARAAERARCPR
jgi:hypothetical protein